MIYESKRDGIIAVPEYLAHAINEKLDAAIAETPGAAADREYLYSILLGFFDEYGYLPEFSLQKRDSLEQDGRMPDAAGETSLLQRKEGSIE